MKKSFNSQMEDYRILIWNAEDPIIKSKIEPFGYTTEKINEGKSLYEEVVVLAGNQRKEYSEQYSVSSQFIEKRQEAENKFISFRKYARFAFRNIPEADTILNLSKRIPTSFPEWLHSTMYFYERLIEKQDWITSLAPFGVQPEDITNNLANLSELKDLQELRQRETGDAQRSTKVRNAKFDELKHWYSELRDLTKVILVGEDSQYLEKLGILVR